MHAPRVRLPTARVLVGEHLEHQREDAAQVEQIRTEAKDVHLEITAAHTCRKGENNVFNCNAYPVTSNVHTLTPGLNN